MVAGLRSTKTTTEWSSSTFHSPTTTPCWIRRRWTSQGGFSRCWRRTATTKSSRREKSAEVHSCRAGSRWLVVWTVGGKLHLRNNAGAARPGGDGCRSPRALYSAGCGVVAHGAERGWRLGRDLRLL